LDEKFTAWIFPCNMNYFDPIGAFAELQVVDWRQSVKLNVGDEVFIYCSKPYQKIMFRTTVVKTCISSNEVDRTDEKFNKVDGSIGDNIPRFGFARLKLMNCRDDSNLHIDKLIKHGLVKAPQGQMKVSAGLYDYLVSILK